MIYGSQIITYDMKLQSHKIIFPHPPTKKIMNLIVMVETPLKNPQIVFAIENP